MNGIGLQWIGISPALQLQTGCHRSNSMETCHIIMRGKVRVYVVGDDGHELSVCILGPGEIIGEMAMFEEVSRSANIQALEPTAAHYPF